MTRLDASGSDAPPALQLSGIGKRFGDLWAVRCAELAIRGGGIHAVVGENGAGKSTLLKIAVGILAPDAGEVVVFGERLARYDAAVARRRGVAMVQQHFALFSDLTVLENLMLGAEPVRFGGRLDLAEGASRAARAFEQLGASLPLHAKVASLGVGDKQRLEIARALFRDARVVILDEPTAILTPGEVGALFGTLRKLVTEGRAVVVVTHKLDEVDAYADVVTVMRRGETRGTRPVERGAGVASLAAELLGGTVLPDLGVRRGEPGEVRLAVRGLRSGRALRGATLEVRAGEIVGIAGVLGNGQSELISVLGGLLSPDGGEVIAGRTEVVHEDRQSAGLVLDATVQDNLLLGELGAYTRRGVVDRARVRCVALERIERFAVHPPDPALPARALSGGNQQKIVIARALARSPSVLVVAHPTRGVDLVAARAIHEQILAAADRRMAVLIVSADLAELRCLCTRILVMVRGRVVAELSPDADDETLGAVMLGTAHEEVA